MFSWGNLTDGPVSRFLRNKGAYTVTITAHLTCCWLLNVKNAYQRVARALCSLSRSTDHFFLWRLQISVWYYPHMPTIWPRMWHLMLHTTASKKLRIGLISWAQELYWNADFARTALCFACFFFCVGGFFANIIWISWGSALWRPWKCFDHRRCAFLSTKEQICWKKITIRMIFHHLYFLANFVQNYCLLFQYCRTETIKPAASWKMWHQKLNLNHLFLNLKS